MTTDQLPCGADLDDLIAQVTDGHPADRTPHQAGCPHCQAALAEYDRLFNPVRDLAATRVRPPRTLLDEIMRTISLTVSDPPYGYIPGARGHTRIAGRVVAVTARVTTEQTPGVRVALARQADRHRNPDNDNDTQDVVVAGVAGLSTALQITLAADYGQDLHTLADRVRAAVAHAVTQLTGLHPVHIAITIDDVFEPAADS